MAAKVVWCLTINHENETDGTPFEVGFENDTTIGNLKKRVKEEKTPDLDHLAADRLHIWRCKDRTTTLDRKNLNGHIGRIFHDKEVEELNERETVADLAVLATETLLVRIPKDGERKRKRAESSEDAEAQQVRARLLRLAKLAPSSLAAEPSKFEENAKDLVDYNRPFNFGTIPITLLQREMAEFRDDWQSAPPAEAQTFLQRLSIVACKCHNDEISRRSEVQQVFQLEGFDLRAETIPGTDFRTDGNLQASIMPPLIRECKNEQGCALYQAIAYYTNFLARQVDRYTGTCFPCILMLDVGTFLAFYGCLWTGKRISVEPLTPWYDLATHWADESIRRSIATSLSALKNTVRRLEAHYAQVPSLPPRDCTYPYPTNYVDEAGREIDFKYTHRVPGKLVFIAEAKDTGSLIVKFVRRYSAEAHRFLVPFNCAPTLRAATSIPGGWTMVIMDLSPHRLLCDPDLALSVDSRNRVVSKITQIIKTLHTGGFVHGDIRPVNILIDDKALAHNKDFTVQLLDFDWAGRIGEVKYPSRVNTLSVTRPKGVTDGADITVEHDLAMIERLF